MGVKTLVKTCKNTPDPLIPFCWVVDPSEDVTAVRHVNSAKAHLLDTTLKYFAMLPHRW